MFLFTGGSKDNVKFHVKQDSELCWRENYLGPTICSNDTVQEGTRGYKRTGSVSSDLRLREENQNLPLKQERGTFYFQAPCKSHIVCSTRIFIKHNEQLQTKSCWCLTSTRQMLSGEKREWILIMRGFQAASLNGKSELFTVSTVTVHLQVPCKASALTIDPISYSNCGNGSCFARFLFLRIRWQLWAVPWIPWSVK